jgi:hypothetical protein
MPLRLHRDDDGDDVRVPYFLVLTLQR